MFNAFKMLSDPAPLPVGVHIELAAVVMHTDHVLAFGFASSRAPHTQEEAKGRHPGLGQI